MALALEPGVSTMVFKGNKHIIKDYPEAIGPFLNSTINVSTETITKNRATVQKFMDALAKAYRDASKNSDDLAKVAVKWFPSTDVAVMEAAIQRMIKARSFPADTTFTRASFEKNLEYLRLGEPSNTALQVKWEDIADTSFAEAATKAAAR
jgi:ABC-type nitrate/sulfonate/bicarbonate transport system substrate-binding protein